MLRICCISYINTLIVFNDFRNEMLLLEMLQDGEDSHLDYVEKRSTTVTIPLRLRAVGKTHQYLTDEGTPKTNIRKGALPTVCAAMF